MRQEYDFSKSKKNPYAKKLTKQLTLRVEEEIIDYFQTLSKEVGLSYQDLIHLYLKDCAHTHRKPSFKWAS